MVFDALSHLKQGVNIDKQNTTEQLEKDKEYNKPLTVSLEEQKQELKDSIFGNFKNPKELENHTLEPTEEEAKKEYYDNNSEDFSNTPTEKEYFQNQKDIKGDSIVEGGNDVGAPGISENEEPIIEGLYSEPLKENKYFPLVKRLNNSGQLPNEAFENIQSEIFTNNGEFDINNINIPAENKELLEGLMVHLDESSIENNIINLGKDLKGIQEFDDFNSELNVDGKFESNVLNDIGKNYIKIPDAGNNIDVKADISTAIESTSANILKEIKNIPKDSQTYKTAINNIDSDNLKQQLEGINSLYTLAYSGEGKLAKKDLNINKEKRKKELLNNAQNLELKIQEALKSKQHERFKKLDKQKDIIIAEVKELVQGDIFEAGEIDKITENEGNIKEQA